MAKKQWIALNSCGMQADGDLNMKKKVVVAGHICLDITPVFAKQNTTKIEEIMVPGQLVRTEGVDIHTGGAVANTGLAMKFLGADVKLMGKVGKDEFGSMILQILQQQGYDGNQDMICAEEEDTSYSIVMAFPGIDRIFLHNPGANDTFCYDDLDFSVIKEAALFHFGYPPIMKRMYADEGAELVRIMKQVKGYGVATSLDMAAMDPNSEAGKSDWKKILSNVLPYVDFFVPSIEELCYMLDKERYTEWIKRAEAAGGVDVTEILSVEGDIKPLADMLLEMGAKAIMIKCGAPGLYYRTAPAFTVMDESSAVGLSTVSNVGKRFGLDVQTWADKEGFERSYRPEKILSGTGAGDTSIAAFLTAMLEGYPIEHCIRLAAATGASCVEGYDALSALRTFEELEEKIKQGWAKRL